MSGEGASRERSRKGSGGAQHQATEGRQGSGRGISQPAQSCQEINELVHEVVVKEELPGVRLQDDRVPELLKGSLERFRSLAGERVSAALLKRQLGHGRPCQPPERVLPRFPAYLPRLDTLTSPQPSASIVPPLRLGRCDPPSQTTSPPPQEHGTSLTQHAAPNFPVPAAAFTHPSCYPGPSLRIIAIPPVRRPVEASVLGLLPALSASKLPNFPLGSQTRCPQTVLAPPGQRTSMMRSLMRCTRSSTAPSSASSEVTV